ncbi:MAG: right-handed parallel beta-helix repeat-containing protein [Blastocatellia bacterium]
MRNRPPVFLFTLLIAVSIHVPATTSAAATTYEVGPGKPYADIGDVPWESLQPGDTVLIYWRATPYKEKWVICREGTAAAPITVRGVPGPGGEAPVIDGNGATTRSTLNYRNENRSIIKIGGATVPADTMPRHITIENLEIRGARPPYTYTAANGSAQSYVNNASSIYVEKGENITVRNCRIHDSGNGFFVASSETAVSRDILVEANYIYDNGNSGSIFEHNNYTAALGITFQYNRFGPPRAGASGNNLKDRSAGLVVRYNWIEGGNRQLDLVDGEDSSIIRNDPRYRETHVYGNILIEPVAAGNRQMTHYGGDSGGPAGYRKGTLYFYQNTLVSTRTDRTTLFRLSTNDERCDARNNVFHVSAAGGALSLLDTDGVLDLSHNWLEPGWVVSFGAFHGAVNDDGTSVQTSSPGFVNEAAQDYFLASGSVCINAGGALNPVVPPTHEIFRQYVKHQTSEARPSDGQRDIGAYETRSASSELYTPRRSWPRAASRHTPGRSSREAGRPAPRSTRKPK